MESTRQKKVARLIQKELSIILQKEAPGFLGNIMVSVTIVRMSPDLANANIFVSIFPATNPAEAAEGTIRKQFAQSIAANAIHGSDSDENAAIEGNFHFTGAEIF